MGIDKMKDLETIISLIAEGYEYNIENWGEDGVYLNVENPNFQEDNGKSPVLSIGVKIL
jgi:hypothetical protein